MPNTRWCYISNPFHLNFSPLLFAKLKRSSLQLFLQPKCLHFIDEIRILHILWHLWNYTVLMSTHLPPEYKHFPSSILYSQHSSHPFPLRVYFIYLNICPICVNLQGSRQPYPLSGSQHHSHFKFLDECFNLDLWALSCLHMLTVAPFSLFPRTKTLESSLLPQIPKTLTANIT